MTEIDELKQQNTLLLKRVVILSTQCRDLVQLSKRYDDLVITNGDLKRENIGLEKRIDTLTTQIDELEKHLTTHGAEK